MFLYPQTKICLRRQNVSIPSMSYTTIMYVFSLFLVFKLYKSDLQIINLLSEHIIFLGRVDIGGIFSSGILWKVNFKSWSFFRWFFWPVHCTSQVCISYHIWTRRMFHLRGFSIGICKKHISNQYLLFSAIVPDLEMKYFWSVNYICLVYELKFLFWTCSKFWAILITDL